MKLGLVLDGGGAKGAYQIGVWKAMREFGLDRQVTAIAGTSVGGLNAVLFAQGDFELAYHIWTEEIDRMQSENKQKEVYQ
ncbi:MAG: patatin-like phospholipase family protein [Oscillospiraceae bacterium]|nr:patatin-like phospholipase family protein [Oscillospiraceae bacterium]